MRIRVRTRVRPPLEPLFRKIYRLNFFKPENKKKKNKGLRGKSVDLTNGRQYNKYRGKKHTTAQFARVQLAVCVGPRAHPRPPLLGTHFPRELQSEVASYLKV